MQAFGTDRQAAKPRRITAVGKRSAVGTSAAHGREASKISLRRAVKRMRNGMALQWLSVAESS